MRLASHLSPAPVSIRIHFPAARISNEFMAMRMRLRASAGETRSHMGFGMTPNIAPPSRRKVPSVINQNSRSPSFIRWSLFWIVRSERDPRAPAIRARQCTDPFAGQLLHELKHRVPLLPADPRPRAPEIIPVQG